MSLVMDVKQHHEMRDILYDVELSKLYSWTRSWEDELK
jgi:hypothetical protein